MDKIPVFVGIDVAKHRLEVHLRPSGESFTIDYSEEEVTALVERLGALEPVLIVLEPPAAWRSASPRSWPRLPCRWQWSTRARSAASRGRWAGWPRPTVWMPR